MTTFRTVMLISVLVLFLSLASAVSASNSTGVKITVSTLPAHHPGSGGGSGSGGSTSSGIIIYSNEGIININLSETRETYITYNMPVTYYFLSNNNPIYSITVTGTRSDGDTPIRTEVLKGKSKNVKDVPGKVYKYLNIIPGTKNIGNNNIIKFKVPVQWLEENGIAMLYHWDNNEWNQLSTSFVNSDDEYYYYQASTPSFSPFAIAAPVTNFDNTATETIEPTTPTPNPEPISEPQTQTEYPTPTPVLTIPGFELLGALLMLCGIYLLRKGI